MTLTWIVRCAVLFLLSALSVTSSRKATEVALHRQADKLERFNRATVRRKLDMIALKKRGNELSRQLGQDPPYARAFLDAPAARPKGGGVQ